MFTKVLILYACVSTVRPPATTPTPPGNCSDPTWIPNGDYCYYASVNHAQSWPEANYQCQKAGMDLVSVHSKAEMDFVLNLVTQAKVSDPQKKPNIWIGLTKGPDGEYLSRLVGKPTMWFPNRSDTTGLYSYRSRPEA